MYEEVPRDVSSYGLNSSPQSYIGSPDNRSGSVNKWDHWIESSLTLPIRKWTNTNLLKESTKSLNNNSCSLFNHDTTLAYEPILH